MPSDAPIPIRPRRRRPPEAEAGSATTANVADAAWEDARRQKPRNGARQPAEPGFLNPEITALLGNAIEDLAIALREAGLPPVRLEWQKGVEFERMAEVDPRRVALKAHVESFLADHEGLRAGPIAWPLNQIQPPENPDSFLIGNLIRPGTTVMLAGPPGAAKSWAARQLALAAGAGLEMFLDRYEITRPMSVLVVDEDNGPDEEWRRDERLMAHLELTRDQVAKVRRISLADVKLDQERWQLWLRGAIRLYECDLVILDPVSEMHGGKELREDPAFRSLIAFVKRLKVDFPHMATVLVHHTRKLPASERQTHRGLEDVRGQWGQTPDVVVMISPLGDRRAKWEVHKRVAHSSLILEQVPQGHVGEGGLRMVADETVMRDQAAESDDKVLNAIEAGARTTEEIRLGTGLSKSGVYKVIKRLAGAGLITRRAPFELVIDPTEDEL